MGRASGGAAVGYRSLFSIRDYRRLYGGLAISLSGTWAYNVALVVYVYNATHSAGWVAAASMTRFVAALLSSPWGGLVADRVERVRLMVSLDVLALAFQGALALVAAAGGPVLAVLALAALSAVATSAYDPAARAVTPVIVGAQHLAAANSAQSALENLAIVVGPGIASLLLLFGSPAVVFAVNGMTFGVSAILVSRIHTRDHPGDTTAHGTLAQMADGVRAFAESSTAVGFAIFSILASFVYGTDSVLLIVVSRDRLGTGSAGYGYLLAALGVGGIVAAGVMNRVTASRRLGLILVAGMAIYCLPTALLTLVHSAVAAFALEMVRGAGTIVVDVLAITALQRLVDPDVVARVFGVFFALVLAAVAIGALVAPILLATVGLTTTLLLMGLVIPALMVTAYPWIRRVDTPAARRLTDIEPVIATLRALDILQAASRVAVEHLARSATLEIVGAGHVLVENAPGTADLLVLAAGEVDVSGDVTGGEPHRIGAPAVFGARGLLGQAPWPARVTAVTECTVYRVPWRVFADALTSARTSPKALGRAQVGSRVAPPRGEGQPAGRVTAPLS